MNDRTILNRIQQLVEAEAAILAEGDAGTEHQRRLHEIEETIDQLWDYLRQRRAARAAGRNPDTIAPRPIQTVEHYLQ